MFLKEGFHSTSFFGKKTTKTDSFRIPKRNSQLIVNFLFKEAGEAINKDLKSFQLSHSPQTDAISRNVATFNREAFLNYVDKILAFLTSYLQQIDI